MIERLVVRGRLFAAIIRAEHRADGIEFLTPGEYSQQLACMSHPKGHTIPPHVHNEVPRQVVYTKETLFVRRGRVRVDLYDEDRTYLESRILGPGDVVLLAYGGHGFEMLEDSDVVEVKQGPYVGVEDKMRFTGVPAAQVRVKVGP